MLASYLCISIPVELQQYQKTNNVEDDTAITADFGVKIVKDSHGDMQYAAYYSDSGELLKKIFYKGSSVAHIKHYRNEVLYSQESFDNGKLKKKITYNKNGTVNASITYEYNSKNLIVAIRKIVEDKRYEVEYGYDELSRVDSRLIKYNSKIQLQQMYRYDILDRVVEYRDRNQYIKVHKINPNNELISYTITDIAGNDIIIVNKYLCSDYIGTEIDLNGHKTTTLNELSCTKRHEETDISNCIISKEMKTQNQQILNMQNVKPLVLDLD